MINGREDVVMENGGSVLLLNRAQYMFGFTPCKGRMGATCSYTTRGTQRPSVSQLVWAHVLETKRRSMKRISIIWNIPQDPKPNKPVAVLNLFVYCLTLDEIEFGAPVLIQYV